MKILFVINDFIIEPLGIMYLSSSLKQAGHQVNIIKTVYKEYEKYALINEKHYPAEVVPYEEKLIKDIQLINPDIVAFSATTGMHSYYLRINQFIKKQLPRVKSIFGGPHPTFFPEVIDSKFLDAICLGEGDNAFVDFVNALSKSSDFTNIPNIWAKSNGKLFKNDVRPLIENLDTIPFPDREIIYNFKSSYKNPIKNFIIGRGCPYDCTYCFNHAYSELYAGKGKRVRLRSPENVLAEILNVKKTSPLEIVYFQDDIFVLSQQWLKDFLPAYSSKIKLPYHCHLRANLVTDELLKMLKNSGCISVTLALEAGNDQIRNQVLNRNMSKEQIFNACKLLHMHKIKFRTENMIGLPGETINTALETLKMNIKCRPAIGWASLYQPYPKTKLGIRCKEMGLYNGSLDSIKPSFFEESILLLKDKRKIENLQKLFSLIVEFPVLLPLALILINLPPNKKFNQIYTLWKEYCYSRRLYNTKQAVHAITRVKKLFFSIFKKTGKFIFNLSVKADLFFLLRWFQRKNIIILAYHGITPGEKPDILLNANYKHVSSVDFQNQMAYIKKYYNILPLSEIVDKLAKNLPLPNNTLAITFDDGYQSVYNYAFETLKKNSLPAAIFIVADLINTDNTGWFDKVEMAFDAAYKANVSENSEFKGIRISLGNSLELIKTTVNLKEMLKSESKKNQVAITDELLQILHYDSSKKDDNYVQLTNSQIQQMQADNIEFAGHTLTHPVLTKLNNAELKAEIIESKNNLKDSIKSNISLFSYPYGNYNDTVCDFVKKAGYTAAVTTTYGLNKRGSDLFRLKRIGIMGTFSLEYFICSLYPPLRHIINRLLNCKK